MRLIDRYFLREFVPPFVFSLFALTFILLMDQLFRLIDLIVRKGLALSIVGQILVYNLPLIVSYTAPMAVLIAIVMSFGRFSQDNEILALKTSGVPFIAIMRMPFIVVALLFLLLCYFNCFVVPEANHRTRGLMLDVARKRPAVRLPEGVFTNEFPGYTIYIGHKDERTSRIKDVTIYDLRNNYIISAPRGELQTLDAENILRFTLYEGELHQLVEDNRYQRTAFAKQEVNMQLDTDLVRRDRKARSEDELTYGGLRERLAQLNTAIADMNAVIDSLGRNAVEGFRRGDQAGIETARFQADQKLGIVKGKLRERARTLIEMNKKFSLAFACLVFLLIGAPLGYLFRRGGVAGVLLGILLFSLYYILVLTGEEYADRRSLSPFIALWVPNLVLLVPGLVLFWIAEHERIPFIRRCRT